MLIAGARVTEGPGSNGPVDVFSEEGRRCLSRVLSGPALLAFDFDGTLAALTKRADLANIGASTRAALGAVAARWPTAVVSGRSRRDLVGRLEGIPLGWIVGNHGLESGLANEVTDARIDDWKGRIKGELWRWPGVWMEDKGYSLTMHLRGLANQYRVERELRDFVADFEGIRLVGGKSVLNLSPTGAGNKGTAITSLRHTSGADGVLYVGDDETDEDVFALGAPWLMGVRVGRTARTRAPFMISARSRIDEFLGYVLDSRLEPLRSEAPTGS